MLTALTAILAYLNSNLAILRWVVLGLSWIVIAWGIHHLDVILKTQAVNEAQKSQKLADNQECLRNQKITEEAQDDYQSQIDALNIQFDALKRLPSRCVPIVSPASKTCISKRTDSGAKPITADGVTASALYNFAATDTQYWIQFKDCKKFVDEVWASH